MPRPKEYDHDVVLRAARDVFWEQGYEATSLADIEARTGLNRSSLYQAFGSKHGLFEQALQVYLTEVAAPRLDVLRGVDAGIEEIAGYFTALGATLRRAPEAARRGCMMVNSIAELAGYDHTVDAAATTYGKQIADALHRTLRTSAARGEIPATTIEQRVRLLTGLVLGVLLTARLDVHQAAALADAAAAETRSWPG